MLSIDPEAEVNRVCEKLRYFLAKQLKRRGYIVALSGGIDSSVTTALVVRAVGPERALALLMPERHSADETLMLSNRVADHFGVPK
ncbi:MAG: NAD(+) synthase, partial [Deltaproteobacteria bacterium]|nr:NAD(+) synthase [Deltaproteobacteria bacterium]